ncbi:MAG: cation transporter [Chitinophagales bacterium]|nr:cation transporter [Chitinophagales bacterium]
MTHTYLISGMTCGSCLSHVKSELLKIPEVLSAEVSLNPGKAIIEMSEHITLKALQQAISPQNKYIITADHSDVSHATMQKDVAATWLETYKPLLLIFGYITIVSLLAALNRGSFDMNGWMNNFMAGFFITFSLFKMLDLKGFAEGYSTYDLLAKRWFSYGYIYPFIELFFGIALLTGMNQMIIYGLIVAIMSFSTIGVIQSLLKKQIIQCACLGTIFKLPLGTVTLFEDLLMVAMAGFMIIIMQ